MTYDAAVVGSRLAELRKKKQLSQKELSAQRNISQSMLSMQESGKCMLDAETLLWYADFYGVSVDYLLCRTDIPNIYVTSGLGDQKNITLYTTQKSLSQQEQEQALRSVDEAVNGTPAEAAVSPELKRAIERIVRQVLGEQGTQA